MQIKNEKLKKNSGITLIALAITIIVLLILAGITIATILNNNSVIDRAKEAKEETQIATFKDKLNLAHAQAMMEKGIKGSITIEEYAEILKENEIISDTTISGGNINEPYKDDDGNDIYEVNSDDGFTFDVTIEKNEEEDNITTDNIRPTTEASKPRIGKIDITSVGTNSIAVKVTVSKLDDGKLSYYYKKKAEPEGSYKPLKENTTDLTANFTGLEQNVEYNIKVVATNSQGSHELIINGTTGEIPSGTLSQKGTTTWDPTNHTASIELETTTTGYTIQYQIGGTSGTWQNYTGPITGLNNGDKIYAVIYDGSNRSEPIIIIIEDKTSPTVTVLPETASTTTSSIKVNVTSKDAEYGMPTSPTYKYYIKKSTDTNYPADANYTGTETSYTFTGLKQNTSYDVKVTTVDKANNSGEGTATGIKTEPVGGATDNLTTGNITAGTVTWNKDTYTASVTLKTTTKLTIQYKIGASGTWTPAKGTTETVGKDVTVTNLNHNDLVYARLIDDAGNYGDDASMTILDGTAPTVTVEPVTASINTSSIKVNVTSKDAEYGMPASPTYKYYIKKSTDTNYPADANYTGTETSYTFTGLKQNTSYDVKVTTVDKANNLGEGKAEGIETKTVGGASSGLQTGNITAGAATWNKETHTASVTLSTSTNLTIQYKIGSSGTWTPAKGTTETAGKDVTVTNLNHNDLVYARLIDDAGNYGDDAFMTILDGQAPTVTVEPVTASTTTSSIKVNVTSKDDQGGMPASPTYKYYIKKSSDTNYPADATHTGTENSYTFTGLKQNTSYDVKVTTVDKANNSGEGTATGIKTEPVGGATDNLTTGNITAGTVTWNKETHKASVTLKTTTNLTIQYKIGASGTWTPTKGTTETAGKDVTVTNLNHNDLVYARLIDDAGNYGDDAFMTILDGTAPTVTVSPETASITTSSIKVNVTSKDAEYGMPTSPTYKYYIKKTTDTNYPTDASYSGTKTSYTFTGLVQNTSYDVKVTTVDKANNLGEGKAEKITTLKVGGATGDFTTGNITAGTVTWNKDTHKASVTLKTTTNLTIQYKIGSSGTWTPAKGSTTTAGKDVTVTNLNHNDLVYARLIDDAGNYGDDAFMTILDGTAPTVTVEPETASITTSSIKVNVTSKDDQSGMPTSPTYKYYIKKSSDTNYPTDASYTGTQASYTFTGLVQNTSYDVKVTTVDKANNSGEGTATGIKTKTVGGATGDLTTGNITAGTVTWNKDTHKASVTLKTTTNLTIQYKIGESGTWTPAKGTTETAGKDVTVTNLNHNDLVYARLIDDAGNYGDEAFMTILDGQAPTVTVNLETANITTSNIKVNVTSKDDQGGMPASPTYKYYIKKSSDANYTADASYTGTETSYTFTGLTQNTSYDVKVTTVDKANNLGEGKAEGIETKTVGGASSGLQTGNITAGAATWNKETHKASVTLSTSTNLTIQYKIGASGTWTPAKGTTETAGKDVTVTNLNHNDLVYARLIDDAGNYGDEAFITILDGIVPSEPAISLSATSVDNGANLTATVTHTDNESGVNKANSKYIWNTTAGKLGTTATEWNTAKAFTNNPETITLDTKADGTYYLHVLTVDNGGNKAENVSEAVTIVTPTISDIIANATNKEEYYGKIVTNYTVGDSTLQSDLNTDGRKWKIFYAGSDFSADGKNHIYLIADDYVARTALPKSSAGHALNDGGSFQKAAHFDNILGDYTGSASITNSNINKLNNSYFSQNFTSTNKNMKAVAYMLDTNAWSVYRGTKADYAIGGPSVEMLMKSYSQAHSVDYQAKAINSTGYQISKDGGANWTNNYNGMLSTSDSLYVLASSSNAYGFWLASPSANYSSEVMIAYNSGRVGHSSSNDRQIRLPPASLSII